MSDRKETISEIVGEGVHTGLRKFCESDESSVAWKAIQEMPDGEWSGVCEVVADEIVRFLRGSRP